MVLLSGLFEKWQFEPQLGARGAPLARIRSNQFPRLGQWRGQAGLLANIGSGEIINRRTINSDRRLVFKFYTPLHCRPNQVWIGWWLWWSGALGKELQCIQLKPPRRNGCHTLEPLLAAPILRGGFSWIHCKQALSHFLHFQFHKTISKTDRDHNYFSKDILLYRGPKKGFSNSRLSGVGCAVRYRPVLIGESSKLKC